jgi:hypothetical protein
MCQNVWAEIEHGFGYKPDGVRPPEHERRFARLSALLELADDEFVRLRTDVDTYRIELRSGSISKDRDLNDDSVRDFVERSPLVSDVENQIVSWANDHLALNDAVGGRSTLTFRPESTRHTAKALHAAGLHTIGDVESAITRERERLIGYLTELAKRGMPYAIHYDRGFSLIALGMIVAGVERNHRLMRSYVEATGQEGDLWYRYSDLLDWVDKAITSNEKWW